MNKKKIIYFILLALPALIYAHELILNVTNNQDNTITVEGLFDTEELTPEAQVRLEALNTGEVLYKKRLPQTSKLTIKIPKEPYQIVLDGGPHFQEVKEGIAPNEGFSKNITTNKKEKKLSKSRDEDDEYSTALIITITLAFLLLFMTIIISILNTNKLMSQLRNSK